MDKQIVMDDDARRRGWCFAAAVTVIFPAFFAEITGHGVLDELEGIGA